MVCPCAPYSDLETQTLDECDASYKGVSQINLCKNKVGSLASDRLLKVGELSLDRSTQSKWKASQGYYSRFLWQDFSKPIARIDADLLIL
jgi:hypothetical protein